MDLAEIQKAKVPSVGAERTCRKDLTYFLLP